MEKSKKSLYGKFILLSTVIIVIIAGMTSVFAKTNDKTSDVEKLYQMENKQRGYTDKMIEKYPELKDERQFDGKYEIIADNNGYKGVFDKKENKFIIPQKYREINTNHIITMFFSAYDKDGWKILDYRNEPIFESKDYDQINTTWCGFETIKDDKIGMINLEEKEILKPQYESIECQEYYQEHGGFYYITQKDGKYGVTNMNGEEILPPSEKKILPLGEPISYFITETDEEKQGIIDKFGNVVIEPEYETLKCDMPDKMPYFVAWKNPKSLKILNVNGKKLLSKTNLKNKITDVTCLNDKYFAIEESHKKFKIKMSKDEDDEYIEKMFVVNSLGIRCSRKYDVIFPFDNKYAEVYNRTSDERGLITVKGKKFVKVTKNITCFNSITNNGLVKFTNRSKKGIIYKNKIITKPEYEKIYFNRGHVFLRNGDIYDVASYKEFAKTKGKNLKRYTKQQLHFIDDKCFKFTKEDGTEDVYCDESK